MKHLFIGALALLVALHGGAAYGQKAKQKQKSAAVNVLANDTRVFKVDPAIDVQGVRFKNRFGIELAGHLYMPKGYEASKRYPAVAVCSVLNPRLRSPLDASAVPGPEQVLSLLTWKGDTGPRPATPAGARLSPLNPINHNLTPGNPAQLNDYFFLPVTGIYITSFLLDPTSYGGYWSSSGSPQYQNNAYYLEFTSGHLLVGDTGRDFGAIARPFE